MKFSTRHNNVKYHLLSSLPLRYNCNTRRGQILLEIYAEIQSLDPSMSNQCYLMILTLMSINSNKDLKKVKYLNLWSTRFLNYTTKVQITSTESIRKSMQKSIAQGYKNWSQGLRLFKSSLLLQLTCMKSLNDQTPSCRGQEKECFLKMVIAHLKISQIQIWKELLKNTLTIFSMKPRSKTCDNQKIYE